MGPLLIRAWPDPPDQAARIQKIHCWLSRLKHFPFIPVPISDRAGQSLHLIEHSLWEITPWLPGQPYPIQPPPWEILRSTLALLAQVHSALAAETSHGSCTSIQKHAADLHVLSQDGLHQLIAAIPETDHHPLAAAALRWCALAQPRLVDCSRLLDPFAQKTWRLQPCFRDLRPDHLLYSNTSLTGLIDFGAMGQDSPCIDLARLLGEWLGSHALQSNASQLLAPHTQALNLTESEIELVIALARAADLLIGAHWIRWLFVDQIPFRNPHAVATRLQHAVARLESPPVTPNRLIPGTD